MEDRLWKLQADMTIFYFGGSSHSLNLRINGNMRLYRVSIKKRPHFRGVLNVGK
jgi:hypothetical protein